MWPKPLETPSEYHERVLTELDAVAATRELDAYEASEVAYIQSTLTNEAKRAMVERFTNLFGPYRAQE